MESPHLDKMMVLEEMGNKESGEEGDVYKSETLKIAESNSVWKKKKGGNCGNQMLFLH